LALKQDSVVRAFLLTGDENALVAHESARRSYEKTMDELAPEIESEEGRQFLGRIQQRGNAYLSLGEREIELKRQKKDQEALELMRTQAVPALNALEEAISELGTHLQKTRDDLSRRRNSDVLAEKIFIVGLCIAGVILGTFVNVTISRSVSGAIAGIISNIQELVANNLAVEDLAMRNDEIGHAGMALNEMKDNLRSIIKSLAGTADHVAVPARKYRLQPSNRHRGVHALYSRYLKTPVRPPKRLARRLRLRVTVAPSSSKL
jgi:methyl-accepting chemotaxis protein